MRVTYGIHLGCALLLPVGTLNPVQTLKVLAYFDQSWNVLLPQVSLATHRSQGGSVLMLY